MAANKETMGGREFFRDVGKWYRGVQQVFLIAVFVVAVVAVIVVAIAIFVLAPVLQAYVSTIFIRSFCCTPS